jgi:hypothetical protein
MRSARGDGNRRQANPSIVEVLGSVLQPRAQQTILRGEGCQALLKGTVYAPGHCGMSRIEWSRVIPASARYLSKSAELVTKQRYLSFSGVRGSCLVAVQRSDSARFLPHEIDGRETRVIINEGDFV